MNEVSSNSLPVVFVAIGTGSETIGEICAAERALVMISVPWSGAERHVRRLFAEVATKVQQLPFERQPLFFRLEVDEEPAALDWLTSLGYAEFILMGVGSLLWLEHGKAVSALPSPLSETIQLAVGETVQKIVDRTSKLWGNSKE